MVWSILIRKGAYLYNHLCLDILSYYQIISAMKKTFSSLTLVTLLILLFTGIGFNSTIAQDLKQTKRVFVDIRFDSQSAAEGLRSLIPSEQDSKIIRSSPLFQVERSFLQGLKKDAEAKSGKNLQDLSLWYRYELEPGSDVASFVDQMLKTQGVDFVEVAPEASPDPYILQAVTPDFEANQGYLDVAPAGLDSYYAWTIPGGTGSGVTIYDVEREWNQTHEDLAVLSGVTQLLDAGDVATPGTPCTSPPCNAHGTAVMGEMLGANNGIGVTGMVYDALGGLAPSITMDLGFAPGNAILLAVADGTPGDVILLEVQTGVCGLPGSCQNAPVTNCGPIEWIQSAYDAIETATSSGFVVVQAAGNGNVDLDQAACGDTFDRSFRDSGAIIVGAGNIGGSDRQRMGFSSYGDRVDLQGWGTGVMTVEYGGFYTDPDSPADRNKWYTSSFNGTSSASPTVAGAAASIQGISLDELAVPQTSQTIRSLLVATGSPQQGDTSENIGPRPNLGAAIPDFINVPPTADAGGDQTIECASPTGSSVQLDGSGSFDLNGDGLTYTWTGAFSEGGGTVNGVNPVVTLALGVHVISLEVEDPSGLTDSDSVEITVEDTTDPVVSIIGDENMTLECGVDDYVELGATATDVCWGDLAVSTSGSVDTETPGIYEIDYTATDGSGLSDTATRTVEVEDTLPPVLTVDTETLILWPPNHEYHSLDLADMGVTVEDECDETLTIDDVVISSVSSDEDENTIGKGDGDTLDDILIDASCQDVSLRAERQGGGNGRVYTITLSVEDASGNSASADYHVAVPKKPKSTAVMDAAAYSVAGCAALVKIAESEITEDDDVLDGELDKVLVNDEKGFSLKPNYPDPFNPVTRISFSLPQNELVEINVFDMTGRLVSSLVNSEYSAGTHEVVFDATGLPTGIYFYSMRAGTFMQSRRMSLLK